jgi:translation initiation factor IF-2
MSDTKETADKTLRVPPAPPAGAAPTGGARKTLTLTRTVEQGAVRQSFGQGRSKSVQVEVKKTRKLAKPGSEEERADAAQTAQASQKLGSLSNNEMDKRLKALEAAKEREEQEARERAATEEQQREAEAEAARARSAQAQAGAAAGAPAPASQPAAAGGQACSKCRRCPVGGTHRRARCRSGSDETCRWHRCGTAGGRRCCAYRQARRQR